MVFSNEEAFDMLMVLGESQRCFRRAARLYVERYPDRQHHSYNVFKRLAERIRATGSVQPNSSHRNERIMRPARNEKIEAIVAAINFNPQDSTRKLSVDAGTSHMTVWRCLKEVRMHPYHLHMHQALQGNDFENRINFCTWMENQLQIDDFFHHKILWSDEAIFKSNEGVNVHNTHYWAEQNPHWMREIDNQHVWSLNTWCGILGPQIIGPYFFEGTLNGELYENFLLNILPALLEDVPLHVRMQNIWFQQDGCPAHYARRVREVLDQTFPNRWIGRNGPVSWPPRSPDLTILDYYLWGRIKELVYSSRPTTRENMKERIKEACVKIQGELLTALSSFPKRIRKCLEANGRQFEHL